MEIKAKKKTMEIQIIAWKALFRNFPQNAEERGKNEYGGFEERVTLFLFLVTV